MTMPVNMGLNIGSTLIQCGIESTKWSFYFLITLKEHVNNFNVLPGSDLTNLLKVT